jgi:transposase
MQEDMTVQTEVIDDVVVLLEQMKRMGLAEIIDEQIGRRGSEKGLSWGWTISIWLAHMISQGDHRKLPVRDWANGIHDTLELITGLPLKETDFTDDRLTIALQYLSDDLVWHGIERSLGRNLIRVYDLQKKTIRVDATTVSGYREGGENSFWQFGHSKDNPALRQIKVMMATIDPLGFPSVLDVVAGQHADDRLYVPIIERVVSHLEQEDLLIVGDCKMSALPTRAFIQRKKQRYLTPLSQIGETAQLMPGWIEEGRAKGEQLIKVFFDDGKQKKMIAEGYEIKRSCSCEDLRWEERVLIVHSPAYAAKQQEALHKRIEKAKAAILALTPASGKGKRQIRDEGKLVEAAEAILTTYEVKGLLSYSFTCERSFIEKFVGRGRGSPTRQKSMVEVVRYQITGVEADDQAIAARCATLGWRAYATNASDTHLSFEEAILEYRNEYVVEHGFGRLKGKQLQIAPMFVKRDDQVLGLTRLLCLAVGLLTLVEFVVRQALRKLGTTIAGLYLDSVNKVTETPTAERILRAFNKITRTRIVLPDRIVYHVSPLKPAQQQILALLGFPADLYAALARTSLSDERRAIA